MPKLTDVALRALTYDPDGPGRQIHYDGGDIPGFGVMVSPKGRRTFALRYRPTPSANPKLLTIGVFPAMLVKEAREEARKAYLSAKTGTDPLEARRVKREDQSALTVRQFAKTFMEENRTKQGKRLKTAKEHQHRIDKYILPAFGSRKLASVTSVDMGRLHRRIGQHAPYEANRVLALVSAMFSRAIQWGHLPSDHKNPAAGTTPFQEQERERWVDKREMPLLWQAIEEVPDLYQRNLFKLYLLTGLRRSELLALRWRDIDFDRAELRLPDTKAGRPHTVPLSDFALTVLRDLPRALRNPYVFPGNKEGRPLVNVNKSWRRVRARVWLAANPDAAARLRAQAEAEVARFPKGASRRPEAVEARTVLLAMAEVANDDDANPIRLHDLRRTVGSWLAESGASLPLIGKVLNHSNASTTQIYARLGEDAERAALEQHADRLAAVVGQSA